MKQPTNEVYLQLKGDDFQVEYSQYFPSLHNLPTCSNIQQASLDFDLVDSKSQLAAIAYDLHSNLR